MFILLLMLLGTGNLFAEVQPFSKVQTQEVPNQALPEFRTTVTARKPVTAASSSTIRDKDLKTRPIKRPADILQVTPGLFVVQHAGGGKANQYFLRGYDSDHGTDIALSVDGIPVNQVSHGHGQGYADLHWLIPEVVDRVEVLKGSYFSHLGNFATAGGINVKTHRSLGLNQATISGGMLGTLRGMAIYSQPLQFGSPLVAAEIYGSDGPFKAPEKTRRYNVFSKFTKDISDKSSFTLGGTAYGGKWNGSGQIPEREVNAGRLDRFGSLDSSEGGDSNRYSLFGNYQYLPSDHSSFNLMTYFAYYRLDLYSNFTFFSRDAVNGDQINQVDNRRTFGGDAQYKFTEKWLNTEFETSVGLQGRSDNIDNGLRNTRGRNYLSSVSENRLNEKSIAAYVNEEIVWNSWLRSVSGLRLDYFFFEVFDRNTSALLGVKEANVLSPKTSLIFSPFEKTDIFLNYGQGFHSNDARGIVVGAKALNKVYGYELGARTKVLDNRLDLATAGFLQYGENELVYVGDSGGTENKGPSRRLGLEVEARLRILDWIFLDADLNLVKPEFRAASSTANAIPYAPTRIITSGVTLQHPEGYFGRIALFHIGDRPASEDRFFTAQGFTRFDTTLGYRQKAFEISIAVQNLFNTQWREAQFATVSKLNSETSAASCPAGTRSSSDSNGAFQGCEDIHFTPGNPINVQATATVYF